MNFIKYQIICLIMMHGYIFPLGGISLGGGMFTTETEINEVKDGFSLNSTGDQSMNILFALYFDALPKDLMLELSFEGGTQSLTSSISYNDDELASQNLYAVHRSTYYTIKKELLGLSVPFLAKTGLYLGGGYNTHSSMFPSINLLEDLFVQEDLSELFNNLNSSDDIYKNITDINWSDYWESTTGWHIQASLRAELLMIHMLLNAKYTFAQLPASDAIGFPSINLMLGIGL